MPNYGSTTITVTGPRADRDALQASLAATAAGRFAFSLAAVAPEIWRADGLVRGANMVQADDNLRLQICIAYDGDCLALAASLSPRCPTLRFEAWFDCEGTWPEFTAAVHEHGAEICHAWFETTHLASLALDPAEPRSRWAIAFWQRTPDRDRAARCCLDDRLAPFVGRAETAAGWRRSDDGPTGAVFLRPDADQAGHLVLHFDGGGGIVTVLRDVDRFGGYRVAEILPLDDARVRLPELADEIDRLARITEAERTRLAVQGTRCDGMTRDADGILF